MSDRRREVLEFWFGELDERGVAPAERIKRWWMKSDEFDREIEERFGELRREVIAGEHDDWLDNDEGLVAYIVVLDQFSRNLGRGTPVMFEADHLALAATHKALDAGVHREVGVDYAVLVLMPLMHSENLEDQNRCIALFQALAAKYPDIERLAGNVNYAIAHRDIIERFGRFPHRNEILGRETTPEEREFLKQPGSSF